MTVAVRFLRASVLLVFSLGFLGTVFHVAGSSFWTGGIGDWMDPYFINYLLEHWHHSLWTLSDPFSPPIYFPAVRTLGYSHGLVLFAPFYMLVRPFLHPFQAYSAALFLIVETGVICLYLLLRRLFALSFLESLLLTLFFVTSLNVTNGLVGVWSQRAYVFLIPPILLTLVVARQRSPGRARTVGLCASGLLSALMLTQDFYTALFALSFVVAAVLPLVATSSAFREEAMGFWNASSRRTRTATGIAAVVTAITLLILLTGGFSVRVLGLKIASHDWTRPAMLALAAAAVALHSAYRNGWRPTTLPRRGSWTLTFAAGAIVGVIVFLWIYAAAYAEHPAFPDENLTNSLVSADGSPWQSARTLLSKHAGYETLRTFELIFLLGLSAWIPLLGLPRRTRLLCLWAMVVSLLVLVVPVTFNGFSVWRNFIAPLPGFSVIRDPKRIAYLYELAAVLAAGAFVSQLPRGSLLRVGTAILLFLLLIAERNHTVFDYLRPNETFNRWVSAPIAVDPSCSSFYVNSADAAYGQRSNDRWTLYSIDAMFVALDTSIPTVNGYSAWFPEGWAFQNPEDPGYRDGVRQWISMNRLRGVCELDLIARTMKPAS
ncbi:hypothetical protein BH18ACI5_BH18ACI5_20400 [soil metagenome]